MNSPNMSDTVIPWIGKTAKLIHIFMNEHMKKRQLDLTLKQWVLLFRLYETDDVNQQELALITERNKGSLTRLIHNLEKKSLVVRVPSAEDKRANRILLTKKGTQLLESTFGIVGEAIESLQMGLSAKEISQAINTLQKIQHNIKI